MVVTAGASRLPLGRWRGGGDVGAPFDAKDPRSPTSQVRVRPGPSSHLRVGGDLEGLGREYVQRAERVGLRWEDARELSEAEVERRLFRYAGSHEPSERAPIDFAWVHRELRRVGVTLQLLWLEYQEAG